MAAASFCWRWLGSIQALKRRLQESRLLLRAIFLAFPLPFVATLTGWFTAEVGRQPWAVYGVLRTAEATTPDLAVGSVLSTLIIFGCIYTVIFGFGTVFIFRLLRAGPSAQASLGTPNPKRPLAIAGNPRLVTTVVPQSVE